MKSKSLFKFIVRLFVFFVVAGFVISMVNNYLIKPYYRRLIKNNLSIVNGGRITSIKGVQKSFDLYYIDYSYTIGDKTFRNSCSVGIKFKKKGGLLNRTMPVVYQTSNWNNSQIMFNSSDFEYFNVPFPDSLRWLKEVLK